MALVIRLARLLALLSTRQLLHRATQEVEDARRLILEAQGVAVLTPKAKPPRPKP